LDVPRWDEIEISLFGPSYGECILVHLGDGSWISVDSCFFAGTKRPRALQYLELLGIDPSRAIKLVIATHWDDDHVGGIAELVKAAESAEFVFPAALFSIEFIALLEATKRDLPALDDGLTELRKIIELVQAQQRRLVLAKSNSQLAEHAFRGVGASIFALSPSDQTVIDGHMNVGRLLEAVIKGRGRVSEPRQNHRSIVLWVKVGNAVALLGSDLEERENDATGWKAIVNSNIKRAKAQVFKVAHHGSENGDPDEIWKHLIMPEACAAVTPWNRGTTLPCRQDLQRLLARTPNLFITAVPQKRRKERPKQIQTLINLTARQLALVDQINGHVRLRARVTESPVEWRVDLFHGAKQVDAKLTKAFFVRRPKS
jgi:hypothetical protein